MIRFRGGNMKRYPLLAVATLVFAASAWGGPPPSESSPIGVGDYLPDLVFATGLSEEHIRYLGLDSVPPVVLSKVDRDLLVIELLIAQCFKCQKQAPIFEGAYKELAALEGTGERVAMLGVGVGNTTASLDIFRETFGVSFPLLPDDSLTAFDLLGRPGRAPYTIFARKADDARRMVVSVHGGAFRSSEELLEEIKVTLEYDLSVIKGEGGKRPAVEPLESIISRDEIEKLLTQAADTLAAKTRKTTLLKLDSGDEVYVMTTGYGGAAKKLFAKVESRRTICGDCHDSHFIYVFDAEGKIVDFLSISLTKKGNIEWDADEVAFMKDRLIGRSIAEGDGFDVKVDALTGATITSILIFDSLRAGRRLYENLVSEGQIKSK